MKYTFKAIKQNLLEGSIKRIIFLTTVFLLSLMTINAAFAAAPVIHSAWTSPSAPLFSNSTKIYANITDADNNIQGVNFTIVSPAGDAIKSTGTINSGLWVSSSFIINKTGRWNYTVEASDNASKTTLNKNFTVRNQNPTITTTPTVEAVESMHYSYDADASDIETPSNITFSLVSFPSGMTINSSTGLISWTPSSLQKGLNSVKLKAADIEGGETNQSFNITVKEALFPSDVTMIVSSPSSTTTYHDVKPGALIKMKPGEHLKIMPTLTNLMNLPLYGVESNSSVFIGSSVLSDSQQTNELQPGSSVVHNLELDFPFLINEALYNLSLIGSSIDSDHNPRTFIRGYIINLTKENDEVKITNISAAHTSLSCIRDDEINVSVANTGRFPENVVVELYSGSAGINKSVSFTIAPNTEEKRAFSINLDEAPAGSHQLIVRAKYFYVKEDQKSITLTVKSCSLPSVHINEDQTPADRLIDLWSYTTDGINGSEYAYALVSQSNSSLIDCRIINDDSSSKKRYINCSKPSANKFGENRLNVSLVYGSNTLYRQAVVYVDSVNDNPSIQNIPPITTKEDTSVLVNLTPYVSDVDNERSTLSFVATGNYHLSVAVSSFMLDITPEHNWNGNEVFELHVYDPVGGSNKTDINVTVTPVNDAPVINSFTPDYNPNLAPGAHRLFSVAVSDPDNDNLTTTWLLDGIVRGNSTNYIFSENISRSWNLTFVVSDSLNSSAKEWRVTTSTRPVCTRYSCSFSSLNSSELKNATNVTIGNSYGLIDFDGQHIDLSNAIDIDNFVMINEGTVGINSAMLAMLNRPARIEMYGLFGLPSTPVIAYSQDYGKTNGQICPSSVCSNITYDNATGTLVFYVSGFSTYWVVANATTNHAPVITSSPKKTGYVNESYGYDVEATDSDNDPLAYTLVNAPSGMTINASTGMISWTPTSTGNYDVKVRVQDPYLAYAEQSFTIAVSERSRLVIGDVDAYVDDRSDRNLADGDTVGVDAKPESSFRLSVRVDNDFTSDEDVRIRNIVVSARIVGIDDGADLKEESDTFDLSADSSKRVELDFKVPLEAVEDKYKVEIKAEGRDENDVKQTGEMTIYLNVNKKTHDIRIIRSELSSGTVSCEDNDVLRLEVKNLGTRDENDALVKVYSSKLGIDFSQSAALSHGTGSDTEYLKDISFAIPSDLGAGTYPIEIRTYYNGKYESDYKVVGLVKQECKANIIVPVPPAIENKGNETVEVVTPPVTPVAPVQPVESAKKSAPSSSTEGFVLIALLVGANIAVVLLIVLLAVYAFRRKH